MAIKLLKNLALHVRTWKLVPMVVKYAICTKINLKNNLSGVMALSKRS
jgi:hypothetical protein